MESSALSLPIAALSKTLKPTSKSLFNRYIPNSTPLNRSPVFTGKIRCLLDRRSPQVEAVAADVLRREFPSLRIPGGESAPPSVGMYFELGGLVRLRRRGDGPSGGGGGGGWEGGPSGEETGRKSVTGESDEVSAVPSDVIILDVGGMTCGGCAASVKRILESQHQVSSASVNLATETAVVWAVPEAKATENWQQSLGEKLANHLTGCGFKSSLRVIIEEALRDTSFPYLSFVKRRELKETFSLRNARATKSVEKCISDSSQYVGWKAFFEEPIMLLAFVLLGRNLEQRAKLKATSDMTGLFNILPSKARLVVDNDVDQLPSTVEVSCYSLSVGDQIVVLPGDRVPADGIVKAGRSAVDESSFTGEPLPVTKLPGAEVTAGSINLNGTLTVEVKRPGGETVMSDIVRLVEEAQSREAPIQRLADKVSGKFTYGVMALSVATFTFWNVFGPRILSSALLQGSPISLALQLSCSVLVVACPCALGLATPTAVLVGTSLGATRGLLLRGGNVLEKFAGVDTIVFDKTGTLTMGKPIVTRVMPSGSEESENLSENSNCKWTEYEVLRLAAGVESNTIHPVGKAIVEAASAAGCQNVKAADGTFIEEPGSGALATVDCKKVTVGTLEWLQRHGVIQNPFPEADEFRNQSVVYVGVDGDLAGLIYLEDKIRDDAGQVVQSLSKQGLDVYMLSGDKRHAAEYVASVVGIPKERVLSGVRPDEKKHFICELQKNQKVIAMVGDGINDAAALASSDIGIAMGGGVGAASEVSSIVLMGDKLSQVGIPIAAGSLLPVNGMMLTPSIAGALMGLSSMGVMGNSLLLRLRFGTTADDLFPLFDKYGKVVDIFIPRDRKTGDSRGFAFVRYKYADEAQRAVERLDGRNVDGRDIMVQFAKYGPNAEPIQKGRIVETSPKTRGRSRSRSPGRYRNDYRGRSHRRSRSRSRDRYDRYDRDRYRERYRSRERDYRRRSRSRSLSPDHRGRYDDDYRRSRSRSFESASPPRRSLSPRSPSPRRSESADESPVKRRERLPLSRSVSPRGRHLDSRSPSPGN
ncbi:hypothetical protein QJS10_CPB19g01413 [Acorus calamus]|uniref:Uncharacterized protein n=1 Tax=Acorus calamus TaxID=4465 RepID=A0AAV9CHQ1_ACOCL|nr:hypothetical protein QJS10_CPB19g01413 [Acorus calamus]